MGYEIWDRDAAVLVADFDDEQPALAYLRDLLTGLTPEQTTQTIDRMQLVRVSDDGQTTNIVRQGVDLLTLIYAPAHAR